MLGALSVVSVGLGSALAFVARLYPLRTDALETWAGAFLVAGLGLLGSALPHLS